MYDYKGRNIAILGLSLEGCDTAKFLHSRGAVITCADRRSAGELGMAYDVLSSLGVVFQLGEGYLSHLSDYSMVVRTPGMSPRLPQLVSYKKRGGIVTSLTKIFFSECHAPIIGVTGTKGKGTTSTLIARMLKTSGCTVYLGGNVGTPLLSRVDAIRPDDWVVLELSSFQLEDLTQSPHIGVVLATSSEHLANYDPLATNFHPTKTAYIEAKKSIVRYQTVNDTLIVNASDPGSLGFARGTKAHVLRFGRSKKPGIAAYVQDHAVYVSVPEGGYRKLCDRESVKLIGDHNLENIAAASLAARSAGATWDALQQTAASFQGLEHRLEFVRTVRGVTYINDTFSTTPETTIAAIASFVQPLVLIVGGSEKKSDFCAMGRAIAGSRVHTLVVIGDMTERILSSVKSAGFRGRIITGSASMKEIVSCASDCARPGDVVLLSPACASFDMFKNYKERGLLFKKAVAGIAETV
jgi:UDP-N-acetylmuramoylalanine--D-glutamate ligase